MSVPNLTELQRLARATCTELHAQALVRGLLVREQADPGQYRAKTVFPIILAALATGLLEVKS